MSNDFFIPGGTLDPDARSYLERPADRRLFEQTLAGDFCYVLTTRQAGKSSLMVRTARRLQEEGTAVAIVDLTQVGSDHIIADDWYFGIAETISDQLNLRDNLATWWEQKLRLTPITRLLRCLRDIILEQVPGKIVVFIDEIDSTINLPFTDDFFAAIRACYNARSSEPPYRRITFVLLGVATPSDLISDATRTPFNIGTQIDLTDFTFEEAKPLAAGLRRDDASAEQILKHILDWTDGHPYLTQKACSEVATWERPITKKAEVDRLIEATFLGETAGLNDNNLRFVRDRLLLSGDDKQKRLELYRRILQGERIEDDPWSQLASDLKLSGVVKPRNDGILLVRNPIYREVFTEEWVTDNTQLSFDDFVAEGGLKPSLALPLFRDFVREAYEERLPREIFESRFALYESWTLNVFAASTLDVSPTSMLAFFANLAMQMLKQRANTISIDDLQQTIKDALPGRMLSAEHLDQTKVLVSFGDRGSLYRFVHESLYDFFATHSLADEFKSAVLEDMEPAALAELSSSQIELDFIQNSAYGFIQERLVPEFQLKLRAWLTRSDIAVTPWRLVRNLVEYLGMVYRGGDDENTAELLLDLLDNSPNAFVRFNAARALERIHPDAPRPYYDYASETSERDWSSYVKRSKALDDYPWVMRGYGRAEPKPGKHRSFVPNPERPTCDATLQEHVSGRLARSLSSLLADTSKGIAAVRINCSNAWIRWYHRNHDQERGAINEKARAHKLEKETIENLDDKWFDESRD